VDALALIAAVARNGTIGADGDLPWRLPDDLRHFKRTTQGHCLILGRRTWESLPGALPGRTTIVVTRDARYAAEGAETAGDLVAAIARARARGDAEPFVGGGAAIYEQALPLATRLWLTRVDADVAGDVVFPGWRERSFERGFERVSAVEHAADARHAHAFTIEEWRRSEA